MKLYGWKVSWFDGKAQVVGHEWVRAHGRENAEKRLKKHGYTLVEYLGEKEKEAK